MTTNHLIGEHFNMENNKLIAKFMGYSQPHPDYPSTTYWYKQGKEPLTILLFDTDWNWLMAVVEKLESMEIEVRMNSHFNTTLKHTLYQTQICYDLKHKNCEPTHLYLSYNNVYKNRKDSIYNAVVEFIKWYNENNK